MNKSELIEKLALKTELSPTHAKEATEIFFSQIKQALNNGDKVEIRGFGTFYLKRYNGYKGRNPKTGEIVSVPPKKLPIFRTGKDLKERVKTPTEGY